MGLYWEWSKYTLPSGKTIDDVKSLIATNTFYGLPSLGYTDIKIAADVHGIKKSVVAAATYLPISGQDYWQVVSCNGDKSDLTAFVDQLAILHTDYF